MKRSTALATLAIVALTACESGSDFSARPFDNEFPLRMNYQAVYAEVLDATRACWGGGSIIISSARVEGQLYPVVGYGELHHGESAMVPSHYSLVRIERRGSGSLVRVKVGGIASAREVQHKRRWLEYWSSGGNGCPRVGAVNAPKPAN